jgi:hypothetical protein
MIKSYDTLKEVTNHCLFFPKSFTRTVKIITQHTCERGSNISRNDWSILLLLYSLPQRQWTTSNINPSHDFKVALQIHFINSVLMGTDNMGQSIHKLKAPNIHSTKIIKGHLKFMLPNARQNIIAIYIIFVFHFTSTTNGT